MGMRTIIMVNNDHLENILKDSEGFCKKLVEAVQSGNEEIYHEGFTVALVKNPVHHSDTEVYVYSGGFLSKMAPYSSETDELTREHPDLVEEYVKVLRRTANGVSSRIKEIKAEKDKS